MKSQPSIKHESKPGNSAGHRNYQNLLTVDKNSLYPLTTDINLDSNTKTNKNISSEQNDATLTLIPVSLSNHDIENVKTATLISSCTTTTQTTAKLTPVSNSNSDLVHTADTNSNSTTIRNSNESHNTNKSKRYAFINGDSMLKKTDGYLLANSINLKFIVKTRVFPAAKRGDMKDYIKPTKRDFDPHLYIFHAGTNDLSLDKPDTRIATDIINVAESLKSTHSNVAASVIVPRADNFKEKAAEVDKCLVSKCREKKISLISHDNIIPKRHLNKSKLHFNNYDNGVFVRNLKEFLNKYQ